MDLEIRPLDKSGPIHGQDANDLTYTKDRISSLTWVTRLSYLAVLFSIAQIVLNSIHLSWQSFSLVKYLLAAGCVFFISSILIIVWARKSTDAFKSSGELFQPRVNEGFTRVIFIGSLILAGASIVLLVNVIFQRPIVADSIFVDAGDYFNASFITQIVFHSFFVLYFGFVARASFKALKWDNQAVSHLVFVSSILLLAFGLGLVYFSHHAIAYGDYPDVKAHFPTWNLRSLFLIGSAISALSLLAFLVDHRSWRVGFLILGFLLLFGLVLLVNFTGFAYKHTKATYNFYKSSDADTCVNRLYAADASQLMNNGCPAKYLDKSSCDSSATVHIWEKYNPHPEGGAPKVEKVKSVPVDTKPTDDADNEEDVESADTTDNEDVADTADNEDNVENADNEANVENAENEASAEASAENAESEASAENAENEDKTDNEDNVENAENTENEANAESEASAENAENTENEANAENAESEASVENAENTENEASAENETNADNEDNAETADNEANVENAENEANADNETNTENEANAENAENAENEEEEPIDDLFTLLADEFNDKGSYCLNTNCCGVLGQVYTTDLLTVANFGLLTIISGVLILIGCAYFWYVNWIDTARAKGSDYIYLGIQLAIIAGFVYAITNIHPELVKEHHA